MKRCLKVMCIAVAAVFAWSAVAGAATNSLSGEISYQPRVEVHGGTADQDIVVYVDDQLGFFYALDALNALGLGFTVFIGLPGDFATAVASGAYDLILVDHALYFEVSNAWDDIYNQLLAGKSAVIASFDFDGSHDYTGYIPDILGLAAGSYCSDRVGLNNMYVWDVGDTIFTGVPSTISAIADDYYLDNGDRLNAASGTAKAGYTTSYASCQASILKKSDRTLILGGFISADYDSASMVKLWMNMISVTGGPPPAGIEDGLVTSAEALVLHQNAPNPFFPSTAFSFTLPSPSYVKLDVYDVSGRLVETVCDRAMEAGRHSLVWTPSGELTAGVYFYRLESGDQVMTRKMTVLK